MLFSSYWKNCHNDIRTQCKTLVHLEIDQLHKTYLISSEYSWTVACCICQHKWKPTTVCAVFFIISSTKFCWCMWKQKRKVISVYGNISVEKMMSHAIVWGHQTKGSCCIGKGNCGDKKFQCQLGHHPNTQRLWFWSLVRVYTGITINA